MECFITSWVTNVINEYVRRHVAHLSYILSLIVTCRRGHLSLFPLVTIIDESIGSSIGTKTDHIHGDRVI